MSGRDDDIEELRRRKLEELQEQGQAELDEEAQEQAQEEAEMQRQVILRQYLTDGARQRLNSVRMSKPDFAENVEQQLVALAQSGRLGDKIDEDQMRDLLRELSPSSREFDIKRR